MTSLGVVRRACGGGRRGSALSQGAHAARCAALAALLGSCGGGAALLHPAQPLPPDTVSFGAGLTGHFASSGVDAVIGRGRAAATQPLGNGSTAQTYAQGVLTEALVSPGISPWVSARVGLPLATEAGLTYTGRALRLDGRHVFVWGEEWALSLGLAGTALLLDSDSSAPGAEPDAGAGSEPAEFELDASGWGGDVPVVIGYQPLDGFVDVWFGARAGFERLSGDLRSRIGDPSAPRFDAEGSRLWAGGLAGFSLGIPPVWLRFELAGTYHRLSGKLRSPEEGPELAFGELDASGWSLAPSGALVGKF